MEISVIKINSLKVHEHHLEFIYSADQFQFSTKIFYHDVSFSRLIKKYSQPFIQRIVAHIALFEGMKLCSLFPRYYDISIISEYLKPAVLDLFVQIYQGVFGQHWYENNITEYQQPEIITSEKLGVSQPGKILESSQIILTGCGGGKDSILAMKILAEADIPFASMQYSHSIYGKSDFQHHLISQVLGYVNPISSHRISIFDDFTEVPFLKLYFPENSGITAPETPVSIFQSLILMLDRGYNYFCLAHEKSANTGNLYWAEANCEVNHQWGKSLEAEKLLNRFIQENLVSNFIYFSILQPIYDFRIFKNLARYPETLSKIHSCNVEKPWCKKCAKCAYVWLGMMAVFPSEQVDLVFQKNLFDDPDLLETFKQMLGLTEHTPFECIGEVNETRLYMKKCLEKGLVGQAIDLFQAEILDKYSINWPEIEQKYDHVYEMEHSVPDWIFDRVKTHL